MRCIYPELFAALLGWSWLWSNQILCIATLKQNTKLQPFVFSRLWLWLWIWLWRVLTEYLTGRLCRPPTCVEAIGVQSVNCIQPWQLPEVNHSPSLSICVCAQLCVCVGVYVCAHEYQCELHFAQFTCSSADAVYAS